MLSGSAAGDLHSTEDFEIRIREMGMLVPHIVVCDKDKVKSQSSISVGTFLGA